VPSGIAFDVTVTAQDPYGNTDTNYTGTVTFSSSDPDPSVVLPPDYPFTASDGGTHAFSGGFTLVTAGDQLITATDTVSGITGNATVTVTTMAGVLRDRVLPLRDSPAQVATSNRTGSPTPTAGEPPDLERLPGLLALSNGEVGSLAFYRLRSAALGWAAASPADVLAPVLGEVSGGLPESALLVSARTLERVLAGVWRTLRGFR